MQQMWMSYMLLALAFFVYNLAVSWIVHRLKSRNDNHTTTNVTNGTTNVPRRILSRWSLLIDCLFRPLFSDPAHSLQDLELDESVEPFLERLALPSLWLTPTVPTDYLKFLPVWRFEGGSAEEPPTMNWIPDADCAICLDKYRVAVDVCGLPCGHQFHRNCIMVWLQRDNHHCPTCRWPAYQNKSFSI
ncbi:E3 ubiquitin-protein ligase RNF103-like [Daphnia pulicaria]|jgi:hypothetical protein|uniref:E3 ubiquitin-protein ligase RNF103-like n=1 Tax=Daphnia pulicaria TaxID=35523 RepID=UPI001EEBAECF|nr:E3 ubiquitin-protein ligase RNF103-like [Daphnia pulicaria]